MKKNLLAIAFIMAAVRCAYSQGGLCDTAYWNHTYANERLFIYDSCRTITGTIKVMIAPYYVVLGDSVPGTGDGDFHIYVQPDSQYQWMQYYRDTNFEKHCLGDDSSAYEVCASCLNVEEICKGPVEPSETAQVNPFCNGFNDTAYLPNMGEYVSATGPYIYDTVHCWNELHPVSTMILLSATNIPEPEGSSFLDGMKVFPQPAHNDVEFQFQRPPHAITLIKLYTPTGQQMFVYAIAETNLLYLDVSSWPSGEYPYSIVSQEGSKLLKSGTISVIR